MSGILIAISMEYLVIWNIKEYLAIYWNLARCQSFGRDVNVGVLLIKMMEIIGNSQETTR